MSVAGINVLVDETRAIQDAAAKPAPGRTPLLQVRDVETDDWGERGRQIDPHDDDLRQSAGACGLDRL
jgi:hypothetical protein